MKNIVKKLESLMESGIFWGIAISGMILLFIIAEEVYKIVSVISAILGLVYFFRVILPDLYKMEKNNKKKEEKENKL